MIKALKKLEKTEALRIVRPALVKLTAVDGNGKAIKSARLGEPAGTRVEMGPIIDAAKLHEIYRGERVFVLLSIDRAAYEAALAEETAPKEADRG